MLHDLGKIGIPSEILEFPGKLSPQAMNVMRTHVDLTEIILGDSVTRKVKDIALRHHEKLDGSGYPRGLKGCDLTIPQRIVAIADIVSALTGTRSYKDSFPKEKTSSILNDMAERGLIDSVIVERIVENYDVIMGAVREKATPYPGDLPGDADRLSGTAQTAYRIYVGGVVEAAIIKKNWQAGVIFSGLPIFFKTLLSILTRITVSLTALLSPSHTPAFQEAQTCCSCSSRRPAG